MLTFVEEKYWLIELKIIDLIWLVKRIKHLIETFKHITIIYIDYVVNSFIIRQIKFINNNIDKLNMKLIRVSIYLFQFRLDVRYKFDKSHIIFDAFNRLSTNNYMFNDKNDVLDIENFHENMIDSKNDVTYVYNNDLIAISKKFKLKFQKDYRTNKISIKILIMFEQVCSWIFLKKNCVTLNFNRIRRFSRKRFWRQILLTLRREKVYFSWETANWLRVVKSRIHKSRFVTFEITHTLISNIIWIIRNYDEMLA